MAQVDTVTPYQANARIEIMNVPMSSPANRQALKISSGLSDSNPRISQKICYLL
jgi:hypothetical protein